MHAGGDGDGEAGRGKFREEVATRDILPGSPTVKDPTRNRISIKECARFSLSPFLEQDHRIFH